MGRRGADAGAVTDARAPEAWLGSLIGIFPLPARTLWFFGISKYHTQYLVFCKDKVP
jgi:hypothetical protein